MNSVTGQRHNFSIGILPQKHILFFQGPVYEEVEGVAMGSLVSPIVAHLYMEYFEQKALSMVTHSPRIWRRYVDDTFVIQKEDHKKKLP